MAARYYGMVMRVSLDCKGCCRKMKRILLSMKEVESHLIERPYNRVIVSGRFQPSDVAIKIRKRMKRRIEILEIQDLNDGQGGPPPPDPQPPPQYRQGGQNQYNQNQYQYNQNQYQYHQNQYQYEAYPCESYYCYS